MERMARDDLIALLEARGDRERAEALRGEARDLARRRAGPA